MAVFTSSNLLHNIKVWYKAIYYNKNIFGLIRCCTFIECFPVSDGEPCVMGTDKDGLIPLRFTSQATVHISGKLCEGSDV